MLFRRPLLAMLFLLCTAVLLCGVSGYQPMTHTLGGGACCGPLCRDGETVWGPQLRQKMRPPAQPAAQLARQALPGPGRRVSGAGQVRLRASADASGEAAIAAQVKRDLEFYEKISAVEDEAACSQRGRRGRQEEDNNADGAYDEVGPRRRDSAAPARRR